MSAPMPSNEGQRLEVLSSLELLDTPAEPLFDRITRVLAHALGVPFALISLVDDKRQWFKSRVGIELSETAREHAFCAHAILGREPLVVTDARTDERFLDNPLVTHPPHIRFYAGMPIFSQSGHALGTLCALDSQPRGFTKVERLIMVDLAEMIQRELHMREAAARSQSEYARINVALQKSEARFESLFKNSSAGMALIGIDGRWQTVNEAFCRLVGYTPGELRDLTFQDITHPDDLEADTELLGQLKAKKVLHGQLDKRYIRKDGKPVWVNLNVASKVTQDGDLAYFIVIIVDIQARKAAEDALETFRRDLEHRVEERTQQLSENNRVLEQLLRNRHRIEQSLRDREAELSAVIANANDAYISLDESGKVTGWNRVAVETFGWTEKEAQGHFLDELIMPPEMAEMHRTAMARYLTTGEERVLGRRLELPALRKDRSSLTVEVRISALNFNGKKISAPSCTTSRRAKSASAFRKEKPDSTCLRGYSTAEHCWKYYPRLKPERIATAQMSPFCFWI